MNSPLRSAIALLSPDIQDDIFDDERFQRSQKRLTLADHYVERVENIRRGLTLEKLPPERYHGEAK
jgi:hypothetical protein